jgi:hypothetical protein
LNPADQVEAVMQSFAERALFRAFSRGSTRGARTDFKMLWHRDRDFTLVLDAKAKTLTFPSVLPEIPARSQMDREFREWVAARQSSELPDHRRIDPSKCSLACMNKKGHMQVTLTLKGKTPDWDYGARKLVTLVHEVYMSFIHDGRYYTYMIDTFDLDPDHM